MFIKSVSLVAFLNFVGYNGAISGALRRFDNLLTRAYTSAKRSQPRYAQHRPRRAGDPAELRQHRPHLRRCRRAAALSRAAGLRHIGQGGQARGAGLLAPGRGFHLQGLGRPVSKAPRGGGGLLARHDEGAAGLHEGGVSRRVLALFRQGDRGLARGLPHGAL